MHSLVWNLLEIPRKKEAGTEASFLFNRKVSSQGYGKKTAHFHTIAKQILIISSVLYHGKISATSLTMYFDSSESLHRELESLKENTVFLIPSYSDFAV